MENCQGNKNNETENNKLHLKFGESAWKQYRIGEKYIHMPTTHNT